MKEIVKILKSYQNKIINQILKHLLTDKDFFESNFSFYYKILSIKHILMLKRMSFKKIRVDLCILIILIDRIDVNNFNILKTIDKYLIKKDYLLIETYVLNKKEFIKKYKFIVDLIEYNFKNQDYLALEDVK